MKFTFLSGTAYPETGGLSTFLHYFLPEAQRAGHQVSHLAFGDPAPPDTPYPAPRISRRQGVVQRNLHYIRAAQRMASASDVTFVLGYPVLLMPFVRRQARRIVAKIDADWSWEVSDRRGWTTLDKNAFQTGPKAPHVHALRAYYLWAARHADLYSVPSQHMAQVVQGWGVPQQRIHVVHNAIPAPQLPTDDRRALRQMLDLPPETPLVVSVARLTPVKGVHVMLRALPHLPEGAQLVVVGDGPQRAELEAAAPAGRVRFVGEQPHERVLMYMRAADVYVLSSFTEGLSHTLLEALAVGTPAVATAVGGNPEVLTDGREGLLVPPDHPEALGQAITRVLSDAALAARMGEAGLARSADFRWEGEVAATLALMTR